MGELKFRAWDGDRMQTVLTLGLNEGFISTNKLSSDIEDFSIMQYTGLKDRNDKEIYEGDIVTLPIEPNADLMIAEIVYEFDGFKFKWLNERVKSVRRREIEPIFHNIHLFEVIGNIFEK